MRARLSLLGCLVLSIGAMALPASASAQQQEGLVNVNISDNVVQVPIGIAANVCDVNVAVLAQITDAGSEDCFADADAQADGTITPGTPGAPPNQDGLINVNISGNTVQVPVAVALNVCDVNIAVLAEINDLEPDSECIATAGAGADGPAGGGGGGGNPNRA
jgi:hypothetical protein